MNHYNFIHKKPLNIRAFSKYLEKAQTTNQYTNYGYVVQQLECRAAEMLKIRDDKTVIAVNNGTSALYALISLIKKLEGLINIVTQSFTFPCAIQGECRHSRVVDFDAELDINVSNIYFNEVVIATNAFGHLQNLNKILSLPNKYIIFDNAATPYSFWKGINSLNYGFASFVSLHHTKTIGFGEGGLIIVSKKYEQAIRSIIAFDKQTSGNYSRYGNNYKMSEIAAAAILQWWDQFDINELASLYQERYDEHQLANFPHKADRYDIFFPNCAPVIFETPQDIDDFPGIDVKKYYKPLDKSAISNDIYNRLICFPIGN